MSLISVTIPCLTVFSASRDAGRPPLGSLSSKNATSSPHPEFPKQPGHPMSQRSPVTGEMETRGIVWSFWQGSVEVFPLTQLVRGRVRMRTYGLPLATFPAAARSRSIKPSVSSLSPSGSYICPLCCLFDSVCGPIWTTSFS